MCDYSTINFDDHDNHRLPTLSGMCMCEYIECVNILQCDDHDDNRLPTCIQQHMIVTSNSCNKEVYGIRFVL